MNNKPASKANRKPKVFCDNCIESDELGLPKIELCKYHASTDDLYSVAVAALAVLELQETSNLTRTLRLVTDEAKANREVR